MSKTFTEQVRSAFKSSEPSEDAKSRMRTRRGWVRMFGDGILSNERYAEDTTYERYTGYTTKFLQMARQTEQAVEAFEKAYRPNGA